MVKFPGAHCVWSSFELNRDKQCWIDPTMWSETKHCGLVSYYSSETRQRLYDESTCYQIRGFLN